MIAKSQTRWTLSEGSSLRKQSCLPVNTQSVHQFSDRHGVIAVVWNSATEWQVISVGMMYLLVLVSVPLSFCCILQHCWKALAQFVMKGFNKSISLTRSLCLNIILLVCCPFSIQQFIFWRVSVPLHLQQMTLFFFCIFVFLCSCVINNFVLVQFLQCPEKNKK